MLRAVTIVLAAIAVACEAFAYWGLATFNGRRAFDEMAGILPFASGIAGGVLMAAALLTWYLDRRRRMR